MYGHKFLIYFQNEISFELRSLYRILKLFKFLTYAYPNILYKILFSWTTCNLFSSTQMIHELEGSNLMLLCFFVYFPSSPKQCESLNHQTGCLDVALLWSNKKCFYMFVCFLHFETHNIFNTYALLYMNDPSWKTSTSTWVEKMLTAFYIKIFSYLEFFNAHDIFNLWRNDIL